MTQASEQDQSADIKLSARRVRRGGAWAIIGKTGIVSIGFAINVILVRFLTAEQMGLYYLAFSVVTAGSIIGQLGLDRSAIRFVSSSMAVNDYARCKTIILNILLLGAGSSIFIASIFYFIAGQWLLSNILKADILIDSLFWLSIWMVAFVVETLIANIFRGFHDIRLAVFCSGLIRSGTLAIILFYIWFTNTVIEFPLESIITYSAAVGTISTLTGMTLLAFKTRQFELGSDNLSGELLNNSLPLMVYALLLYIVTQSNLWILGAFSSKEDVAFYGVAMRMVLLVGVSTSIVNAVVPPLISEKYTQGKLKSIESLIRSATTVCGFPAIVVLIFYIFGAEWALEMVFGDNYVDAALVMVILSVGELIKVLTGPCSIALNMTGHQVILMKLSICRACLTVFFSFMVVDSYGITGVALVYATCLVANDLASFFLAKKYLGIWTHVGVPDINQLFPR